MKNKITDLEKQLESYIKEKHTQEECNGFIDGYESAKDYYSNIIVLTGCLGAALGSVFGALLIIFKFI
jgi:hypothetical protein